MDVYLRKTLSVVGNLTAFLTVYFPNGRPICRVTLTCYSSNVRKTVKPTSQKMYGLQVSIPSNQTRSHFSVVLTITTSTSSTTATLFNVH